MQNDHAAPMPVASARSIDTHGRDQGIQTFEIAFTGSGSEFFSHPETALRAHKLKQGQVDGC